MQKRIDGNFAVTGKKVSLSLAFAALLLFSVYGNVTMFAQAQNNNGTSASEAQGSDGAGNSTSTQSQSNSTSSSMEEAPTNSTSTSTNSTSPSTSEPPSNSTDTGSSNQTSSSSNNNNSTSTTNSTSSTTTTTTPPPTNSTGTTTEPPTGNQTHPTVQNTTSVELDPTIQNATQNEILRSTSLVTISGEPLILTTENITRSYSFPVLKFKGEADSEIKVTITWNTAGSVKISDSRGYSYSLSIPHEKGNVTLFHNSTVVDQRFEGAGLQYDIYWYPVLNPEGYVDKYKFTISGTSVMEDTISLNLEGGKFVNVTNNRFSTFQPYNNSLLEDSAPISNAPLAPAVVIPEENLELVSMNDTASNIFDYEKSNALNLDWSDAVAMGNMVFFDSTNSTLNFSVNGSFFIDPSVITTLVVAPSPTKGDYFGDPTRIVTVSDSTTVRIYVFYYDSSNIVYRTSDDEGETWSTVTSLGTGVLASDNTRWTIATTHLESDTYITIFYSVPAGSNSNFYSLRGVADGINVSWGSPVLMFSVASNSACGSGGSCAAFVASEDQEESLHVAVSYLPSGSSAYKYRILTSTDAGSSWLTTIAETNSNSPNRLAMALTVIDPPVMLFSFLKYSGSDIAYRVFNGTIWSSEQTVGSTGLTTNTFKQISSAPDDDGSAYVAYTNVTSAGSGGILKVAVFKNSTFNRIETADSTQRHFLPNVFFSPNGDININSISDNKVFDSRRSGGIWEKPFNPYGTTFTSPDSLTAANALEDENTGLWMECGTPCNLLIGYLEHGFIIENTVKLSPTKTDYYEGERRGFTSVNKTSFAFYYDGSNIVYKTSVDGGHTWSSTATSTGTGQIASDDYRWSMAHGFYGSERITLLYYKIAGQNTDFYAKTFTVNGRSLMALSTDNLFSAGNDPTCSPTGVCASASGAIDTNGTIFAAFTYKTGGDWKFNVRKSSDGGDTWTSSVGPGSVTSTSNHVPIVITPLDDKKMMLAIAKYESSTITYRIYNGSSWGNSLTLSGTGWTTNSIKQMSADTASRLNENTTGTAYVAYVTGGTSGALKVAAFFGNGTFKGFEMADNTLTHSLPSISVSLDGTVNIFTLVNDVIHNTQRNDTSWQPPSAPYGYHFESSDQLTAVISGFISTGVLWINDSSQDTMFYSGVIAGTIGTTTYSLSPSTGDFQGNEKRIVRTPSSIFAFYYDGSNIRYKYSTNDGSTWSSTTYSANTGVITDWNYRWTLAATTISNVNYVALLYYKTTGASEENTTFYAKRGTISGTSISWNSEVSLFTVPNESSSSDDADASATAATASNGYIYAAFMYEDAPTDNFFYRIMRSTNGGSSWTTSLSASDSSTEDRVAMALTKLSSGRMLFVYLREDSATFRYRVFDGTSWGSVQTISSSTTGMSSSTDKQVSADSDSTGKPFVAYLTGGDSGSLRVVTMTNTGTSPTVEIVDSNLSHRLPSVTVRPGNNNVDVYTLASSSTDPARSVYKAIKVDGFWTPSVKPYDASTTSADRLTVGIGLGGEFAPVMWSQGSSPYTLKASGIIRQEKLYAPACNKVADETNPCFDYDTTYDVWFYQTPYSFLRPANVLIDQCSYPRMVTDYYLDYPSNFPFFIKGMYRDHVFAFGYHWGKSTSGIAWRLVPHLWTAASGSAMVAPETCPPSNENIRYVNHQFYLRTIGVLEVIYTTDFIIYSPNS